MLHELYDRTHIITTKLLIRYSVRYSGETARPQCLLFVGSVIK